MSILGLIGLWRLDEGIGLTAFDTSGYGNDGTLFNTPTWVNGKSGKAIYFDGINQYAQMPNPYISGDEYSISFWSYWHNADNWMILSNGVYQNNGLYAHQDRWILNWAGGNDTLDCVYVPNVWEHWVVTLNNSTRKIILYKNGAWYAEKTYAQAIVMPTSDLFIGTQNGDTATWPCECTIDELRVYNRVLTLNEVQFLYGCPRGYLNSPDGIQLYIKSPSGERLAILSDTDNSGQLLNAVIEENKIGGVNKFSFDIPRNINIPITRNTECYFYIKGELWKSGYVQETPEPDQTNAVLKVIGEGFYKRLFKKVINETYTSQTLDAITKDVANTYLGNELDIYYDVAKIDTPSISSITIEFKDKNLFEVFETLLKIANYDYENNRYRFYVDNEKDFVFEQISNNIQTSLFEGYQYQLPEISTDNTKIVNKILAFRTISGTPKEVEYVNTYEDTESQGRFGLFEQKITFPDYIDSTTINNICSFLLKRKSLPQTKIKIENYEIEDILTFGDYYLSNKLDTYWKLLADCDSLVGWDVGALSVTTLSLSTAHVLTGKRSLKFITGVGSTGEYAIFTLEKAIPFPKYVRTYIYYESVTPIIKITYLDIDDNPMDVDLGSADTGLFGDQWIKYSKKVEEISEAIGLLVDVNGLQDQDTIVNTDAVTETELEVRLETEAGTGVLNIKKIKIEIISDIVSTFYIDRLDMIASIYSSHKLQLEEIKYNLSSIGLFSNMNFGEKEDNVLDEIKEQVKDGNIALSIFSKQ